MKYLFFVCIHLLAITSMAQNAPEPTFGIFSTDEFALKECDFDKNANAVILLKAGKSYPGLNNQLVTNRIVRMKILNEQGTEHGDIKLYYYSKNDFEFIDEIKGVVVNRTEGKPDEVFELDKKNVYRRPVNDRVSEISFALPGVKKGSLLEYRYTSTMKSFGGLEDWEFQSYLPVLKSCYNLTLLENSEFVYRVQKSEKLPILINPDKSNGRVYFEMNRIAALKEEPYMDSRQDFIQKVIFQLSAYSGFAGRSKYMNSWNDVSRELLTSQAFGSQLHKKIDGASEAIAAVTGMNKEARLQRLFQYVRNEMQWDGFYGIYASSEGTKSAWKKRKGSAGDMNLILINLLEEAGFDVSPLLIAERTYKKVNPDYPFLDQFNKVAAHVILNDKSYVLDATDRTTPFGMLAEDLLNTTAFLINRKKGELIQLKQDGKGYRHHYNIVSTIGEDMISTGRSTIYSFNYGALDRIAKAVPGKDHFIRNVLQKEYSVLKVDSLELEEVILPDSVLLKQHFVFQSPLEASGDYYLLNPLPLSGIGKNPFINESRFSDINFGSGQTFSFTYHLTIDPSLETESVPASLRLKLPGDEIVFTRRVVQEKNQLFINLSLDLNQTYYDAEDYETLQMFYKKMYEYLDEQIVLKKISTGM